MILSYDKFIQFKEVFFMKNAVKIKISKPILASTETKVQSMGGVAER